MKSTGTIVRASARSLPTLTAGTERRQYPLVRVTPVVLITPIVRPKSAAGLAIPDMKNQEIPVCRKPKPVLITAFIHHPEPLSGIGIAPM